MPSNQDFQGFQSFIQFEPCNRFTMCGLYVATQKMLVGLLTIIKRDNPMSQLVDAY